jgi:hypothetical protein
MDKKLLDPGSSHHCRAYNGLLVFSGAVVDSSTQLFDIT